PRGSRPPGRAAPAVLSPLSLHDALPISTTERLSSHARIFGIKEARAEAERMDALLAFRSAQFRVYSGDDPTCARAIGSGADGVVDRKSTRLNSSHVKISYAVFCLKKKKR